MSLPLLAEWTCSHLLHIYPYNPKAGVAIQEHYSVTAWVEIFPIMVSHEAETDEILHVANSLLEPRGQCVVSYKILQRLWAGYGNICQIKSVSTSEASVEIQSFILKHVIPPGAAVQDEGHLRKLISYQVEQYFYTQLAPLMPTGIAVAQCIGSINENSTDGSSTIALLLTDLREPFPIAGETRGGLEEKQVYAALDWLAAFHGFWSTKTDQITSGSLRVQPLEEARRSEQKTEGVWLNGGYTYLATRRKEYAHLAKDTSSEWCPALTSTLHGTDRSLAELVAGVLAPTLPGNQTSRVTDYHTLIHGDVKSENLFIDTSGSKVAFFDFQYVGLGLGVCDLAKLLTCSVPLSMLTDQDLDDYRNRTLALGEMEHGLLQYYRLKVCEASGKDYPMDELEMHWNTALVDWLRFQASWGFWGNTEWLGARVRHILRDESWSRWLLHVTERTKSK